MLFFMLNKKMAGPQGNFSGQVQIFSQNPTSCSDFILRQPELTHIRFDPVLHFAHIVYTGTPMTTVTNTRYRLRSLVIRGSLHSPILSTF